MALRRNAGHCAAGALAATCLVPVGRNTVIKGEVLAGDAADAFNAHARCFYDQMRKAWGLSKNPQREDEGH
eukprot:10030918-Karenia_brevis.AAC.1